MMESRVILTQLCKVFTISALVFAAPADTLGPKVKRSDDTTLNSVQTLLQQQAAVIQRLESQQTLALNRLAAVESLSHQQSQEISTLKNRLASTTRQVAFTVYFSADPTPDFGVHGILRFDHILSNTANGYDAMTGIFTSPVSGLYVFHLDVMSQNGGPGVAINIVKNGVALDDAYAQGGSMTNDQGNSLVVVHLNAGERVWTQHRYGATTVRGNIFSVFSGFLIQAD
uniref:Type 2 C1q domain-containing protein 5 n=1 Tax=Littorina littorea TaxID=31216 RepID=A0A411DEP8_LITLI|nr:type 2 C1q domain-containing protein 5 [Littorina littorea]